ncbi:hypothetical protein CCAX7_004200 [Capsulimonas corticalis]|uniref:Uncharacterized protein n=1 Tax=Capsulimonas corticalis TaxID=2219043 RepID=A0A402D2Y2_9BACT|nr:hypothetical protein [Capsulimonas corticalis]BDI28369.1 hypothetical protein CCAX7_004200 [Capsulimonas corticalis]
MILAALCGAATAGCAPRDMAPKATASGASVADRITAIRNNPNIPEDAKARAIAALQGGAQTQSQMQAGANKH